jgi:hypothetical protein
MYNKTKVNQTQLQCNEIVLEPFHGYHPFTVGTQVQFLADWYTIYGGQRGIGTGFSPRTLHLLGQYCSTSAPYSFICH